MITGAQCCIVFTGEREREGRRRWERAGEKMVKQSKQRVARLMSGS